LAKDAVKEMVPIWKNKNLKVKVEDTLVSTKIVCDEHKIAQVIRNLLSNAIKFTPNDKNITISFNSVKLPLGQKLADKEVISAITISVSTATLALSLSNHA
jgi:signal transduction histidine kinase